MKKWITAVLAVLLLAALSVSLSLYFNDQRLNQEVSALKRQSAQYLQERNDQATVAASRRVDLVSTIAQQKSEIERVQKLLEAEQQNAQKIAQAPVATGQDGGTASTGSNATYQTDLDSVHQDLKDLQKVVNKLKANAATLENNLNLPFDGLAAFAPTVQPVPLLSQLPDLGSNSALNGQLLTISQDLNQLGNDLQSLLQRYNRLETMTGAVARSNFNADAANSSVSAITGSSAEKLAANVYAPHGWPVKGPITSAFGPRPSIAPQLTQAANSKTGSGNTDKVFKSGMGGGQAVTPPTMAANSTSNEAATPTTIPFPDGVRSVGANTTPLAGGSAATTPPAATTAVPPTEKKATPAQPTASDTPAKSAVTTPPATAAKPAATSTATGSKPGPTPTIASGLSSSGLQVGAGMEFHTGIDIGVAEGSQVRATSDGVVEYAGNDRGGYGNVVFINHAGGFVTIYGHNSRFLVKAGQTVKAGDIIALSGTTGYSTGPHVHYEIRYQGQIVDPAPFMN